MPVARLSVDDAARYLGLSRPTVKRRIRSGALRAVQEKTPSGFKWFVLVDAPPAGRGGESPPESPIESPAWGLAESPSESPSGADESPHAQGAPGAPETALAATRAAEMARYTREIQAPLLVLLEQQVARLEQQAQEIGALRERLAAAEAKLAEATAPPPETPNGAAPQEEERRPWWWRAWAALSRPAPGA